MLLLTFALLTQEPAARAVLAAEHARAAGASALVQATKIGAPPIRALAARALGRLEDSTQRAALVPLLTAADARVRRAAVGAMAQMRAPYAYHALLQRERAPDVRATIYEAIGRAATGQPDDEVVLLRGLRDDRRSVRIGAARGLESYFRLGGETRRPAGITLTLLTSTFLVTEDATFRQLALLTLNRARHAPPELVQAALADRRPEVRRLIAREAPVAAAGDSSPMVRYEAVRFAPRCADVVPFIADPDDGVALAAIEALGRRTGCDASAAAPLVRTGRSWRLRAAALVWAAMDSTEALVAIRRMADDTVWQARVAAATAARRLGDAATLARLVRDANPNVIIAALTQPDDAVRSLRSDHAGLVLASAVLLRNRGVALQPHLPRIAAAFARLTADGSMTNRDPRVALLTLIGTTSDTVTTALLREALADRDPAIALQAAKILSARSGSRVVPITTTLPIPPIPPAAFIAALAGAQARITMRGLGTMTVSLLTEDAPVTVGVFAQLAESGQYDGLTFHRIVPNFVIQGGSPGADEYDGRTREFMRDELGLARNARGTIGISTRGRDTGDGQIYFNLVDNVRLDRDYTVMATMVSGFEVMDRVQEGDVIERIEIVRAAPVPAPPARRGRRR